MRKEGFEPPRPFGHKILSFEVIVTHTFCSHLLSTRHKTFFPQIHTQFVAFLSFVPTPCGRMASFAQDFGQFLALTLCVAVPTKSN